MLCSVAAAPQPSACLNPTNLTRLLLSWNGGDPAALEALTPLVYGELRRLAARFMAGERPGHVLQATALVNRGVPAADRLEGRPLGEPRSLLRGRVAGHAPRARRHRQVARPDKRGRGQVHVTLSEAANVTAAPAVDLVALDDALETLATLNARQSRVIELRFFGGLTLEEIAHVLDVSVGTVRRDWSLAQAWLFRELRARP